MGEVEQTVTGRREAEKTITRSANRAALKDRRLNQGLGQTDPLIKTTTRGNAKCLI
nr:MAG TPA: hypothetical protein [Caudoviricetes sp.]